MVFPSDSESVDVFEPGSVARAMRQARCSSIENWLCLHETFEEFLGRISLSG